MTYKDKIKKVNGKKTAEIFIFALSTCGWCKKTKDLLNNLGVEYCYVDVDLLDSIDQSEVEGILEHNYDTDVSFPKIILNNKEVISGFNEEEIRKAIKNGKN